MFLLSRKSQADLQAIVDGAKTEVDTAVEEAKQSPFPDLKEFWTDIYYKGTEPPFMRGREKEEVHFYNKEA
jgi:pyruvate dehydrogenase E1 component alpha subunit